MGKLLTGTFLLLTLGLCSPLYGQSLVIESFIRVQVKGLVRHPGLYRLYQGARGADAIQAAGGILPGAELEGLNLASALQDGDSLIVPRHEAAVSLPTPSIGIARRRKARRGAPGKLPTGHVAFSLNAARAEQLDELPGIGPSLARDIVLYRTQHGTFHSLDELREVPGIGEHRLQRLKPFLRL